MVNLLLNICKILRYEMITFCRDVILLYKTLFKVRELLK